MDLDVIKRRVHKLLKLSESPNEEKLQAHCGR